MKAATLMSPDPITISATADLRRAAGLMDANDIRHLPVIDDGELLGVVSERDLLEATGWKFPSEGPSKPVREVMHVPVEHAAPDEGIDSLCDRLVEWGIGCLPVVRDGTTVGIVTDMDLMRAYVAACREGRISPGGDPPVSALMQKSVHRIQRDDSLEKAIEVMQDERIRHLPIAEDKEVVGLISDRDVRRAMGRGSHPSTPVFELVPAGLFAIEPDRPLSDAAERMVLRKAGSVIVMASGELQGILTSTDVLDHCAGTEWGD